MPVFLQGMHQNTLLLWLYPAENGVGFGGLGQLILRKNGDVDIPVCAGQAHLARNAGHRHGMVAGDDFDLHTLVGKEGQGILGFRPEGVTQHNGSYGH